MEDQCVALLLTEDGLWDFFYKLLLGDVEEIERSLQYGEIEYAQLAPDAEFDGALVWGAVSIYLRGKKFIAADTALKALAHKLGDEAAKKAENNTHLSQLLDLIMVDEARKISDALGEAEPGPEDFNEALKKSMHGSKLKPDEERLRYCVNMYDNLRMLLAEADRNIVIYKMSGR